MPTDDEPLPLEQAPPEPGFRPEARAAFLAFVKDSGKTVYKMTTMCEFQIKQKLADFPEEQKALVEALKRGVPDQIVAAAGTDGYDEFLTATGETFQAATGLPNGRWAVDRWAEALGKRPGSAPPPPVAPVVQSAAKVRAERDALDNIATMIVTGGGAFGGFLGCGGVHLFLHLVFTGDAKTADGKAALFGGTLVILFLMCLGIVPGALAALGGWKFGRGSGNPWPATIAAFGAAFGMGTLISFIPCLALFTPVVIAFATFGATFSAATRGGFDR